MADKTIAEKLDEVLAGVGSLATQVAQVTSRMDAVEKRVPVSRADDGLTMSKEGEKIDTILSHLDSLTKRMDSWDEEAKKDRARLDAVCGKMDAMETTGMSDAEKKEAQEKADKARRDAEEQSKAQEKADAEKAEKEEREKADAARADAAALRAKIEELDRRMPAQIAPEDRAKFVDVQVKAERIAQAFGDSAGASPPVNGETLTQYRQRMLGVFAKHSARWKAADITRLDGVALDVAEESIYADAWHAATHPASTEGAPLREVIEADRTGRRISKFYGDPESCWGQFKYPARAIVNMPGAQNIGNR